MNDENRRPEPLWERLTYAMVTLALIVPFYLYVARPIGRLAGQSVRLFLHWLGIS